MTSANSAEQVYQTLERAILSGQLRPRERLVERDLVDRFDVSRTPVREAIVRLRKVGLVKAAGKRGVVVRDFSRQEVLDLYYLRENLERAAAKLVIENIKQDDIDDARQINEKFNDACLNFNLSNMIDYNNVFHRRLLETSRNKFLIEALEEVRLKVSLCRYSFWFYSNVSVRSVEEHEVMLKALEKGDLEEFEEAVVNHMNVAKNQYLSYRAEEENG